MRGDPYESHDPVFGVKESLVIDLTEVRDEATANKYGVAVGTKLLHQKFVLETADEVAELRKESARAIMGQAVEFHNGMPVPRSG